MPAQRTYRRDRKLIEEEAILVAYAMSRLDRDFLRRSGFRSWKEAFVRVGSELGIPAASVKNLRDEFDPIHGKRKGWHQRSLRRNRKLVLGQFEDVSDDALMELVARVRLRDQGVRDDLLLPLAVAAERVVSVADRLRTGRCAEDWFMQNSDAACGIAPNAIRDCRTSAQGYDFQVVDTATVIEVKGLRGGSGDILFTEREWREATRKLEHYWLVVVGFVYTHPRAKCFREPTKQLRARDVERQPRVIEWRASVRV